MGAPLVLPSNYGNIGVNIPGLQKLSTPGLTYLNPSSSTVNIGNGTGTLSNKPYNPGSIYGNTPAPVYAPKLDTASLNAQARKDAANAVNPYYTSTLNNFLAQQAAKKEQEQAQYDINIKNIEDQFKNTTEGNAITKQRTGEDVATNIGQINTAADQNQVDTGNQFEDARLAAARQQAAAGVLGTGAGNRQTGKQTADRNTAEGRQQDTFQQKATEQTLFKDRTFEDLARSDVLAGQEKTRSTTQSKFDFDTFAKNAALETTDKRNEIEYQRQQAEQQKTSDLAKVAFNNWLQTLSNPQALAAQQKYGGSF